MNTPLVSIICPAYNAQRFIGEAITSVINQTWKNWEMLIIDDGSTDDTSQICQSYCNINSRIKLIKSANHGVSHARNLGLKSSHGKYIGFLDADDIIDSNYISLIVNKLELTGADISGSTLVSIDESLTNVISKNQSSYHGILINPLSRYNSNIFLGVSYIFRASSIRDVFFDETIPNGEDFLFLLTMCSKRSIIYYGFEHEGYFYRQTSNSASRNLSNWARSQKYILKKCWSLHIGILNKMLISYKIIRQLTSYHIKSILGMKINVH